MELEELNKERETPEIRKIKRDARELIQNKEVLSDPFWLDEPAILFQSDRVAQFFPTYQMTFIEKLNAITRLAIYLGVALYIVSSNYNWLYLAFLIPVFTIFMYKTQRNNIETYFNNYNSLENTINESELIIPETVKPTVNNPFMNINLVSDSRTRAPATPSWNNDAVMADIEEKFNYNLYRDTGDLYGKNNSQRQFVTMPSTTIPNDQTTFAKWCYGISKPTCKEQSIYCSPEFNPVPYVDTSNPYEHTNVKY